MRTLDMMIERLRAEFMEMPVVLAKPRVPVGELGSVNGRWITEHRADEP